MKNLTCFLVVLSFIPMASFGQSSEDIELHQLKSGKIAQMKLSAMSGSIELKDEDREKFTKLYSLLLTERIASEIDVMNHLTQLEDSSSSVLNEVMRIQHELLGIETSILNDIEKLIGTKAFVSFYYLDRVGLDEKLKR